MLDKLSTDVAGDSSAITVGGLNDIIQAIFLGGPKRHPRVGGDRTNSDVSWSVFSFDTRITTC